MAAMIGAEERGLSMRPFYNFIWRTRHADNSGKPGKLRTTAAMMAKVTDHPWSFDELFETLLNYCELAA
jgi:hypothetical protein